jgi:hypothetical protein
VNGTVELIGDFPVERYAWGTLGGEPFRNAAAMRQRETASAGTR